MTDRQVKLKNRSGDYLLPYTDNIPAASTSTAGKVKLDSSPTSGSNNAITSGAVYTALSGKLSTTGTAAKATADASGNNIANTYLTKTGTAAKATADASGNNIANTYATKTELTTVQNSIPADSGLVHKTGSETIGGAKTLSDTVTISGASKQLKIKNTGVTRGTAPSAAVNSVVVNGLDNAGKSTWGIYQTWATDQKAQVQLICYKGTTTDNTWAGIGVGYDASGNAFTSAVTPGVGSNGTNIATTAYINTKFKKVSALPSSPDSNTYYFIPE